jgi:hypothetical protein
VSWTANCWIIAIAIGLAEIPFVCSIDHDPRMPDNADYDDVADLPRILSDGARPMRVSPNRCS